MKKNILAACFAITALAFYSCKKEDQQTNQSASINITNVVIGGSALTLNTSALTVATNNYTQFTLPAGTSLVNLYPAAAPSASRGNYLW